MAPITSQHILPSISQPPPPPQSLSPNSPSYYLRLPAVADSSPHRLLFTSTDRSTPPANKLPGFWSQPISIMSIHNFQATSLWKDLSELSTVYAPKRKHTLVHGAPWLATSMSRYSLFMAPVWWDDTHAWGIRYLDNQIQNVYIVSGTQGLSIQCGIRFRPCIDIHKGKVKQIVGSTLQDSKEAESSLITNYESDTSAAEYAEMYKNDGLTGGHVIMLGADPLSKAAAIEALHAYPGGLQVGGGVNASNALSYLDEGASHVIVTSYVFSNGQVDFERLKELAHAVGKQRLVLDLSCRKKDGRYAVVTDRWQKFTDVYLDHKVLDFLVQYADEFLVHGVDVEGKKLGIDEELVELLGRHSPIPVSYAGGVATMADLERIKIAGMGRVDVTVGSALDIFGGNLSYKDVVAWHSQQDTAAV